MDPQTSKPPPQAIPLEVPVFNAADALKAPKLGAKRIELNETGSYIAGGLTPNMEMFKTVAKYSPCGVRVMIRPRGPPRFGPDFIYSDAEVAAMATSIRAFKNTGLMSHIRGDGFVFGVLKHRGPPEDQKFDIDVDRCRVLIEAAEPFGCVFHRAFDIISASPRYKTGYDELHDLKIYGILTSAGPGAYNENLDLLSRLVQCGSNKLKRLEIVIGGGVRARNLNSSLDYTRKFYHTNVWMHASCINGPDERLNEGEVVVLARMLNLDLVD